MFETMAAQAAFPPDAILVWDLTRPALGRMGFGPVLFLAGLALGWVGARLRLRREPLAAAGVPAAVARAGLGQAG